MPTSRACWCGNDQLLPFSPTYLRCPACETLVVADIPDQELSRVTDDEGDFYGREYWFSHQEDDLGFTNITFRARTDLPERCVHWLRTLLKFKRPPAHTLELGCAHGGFVALMQWAGFTAQGLELSPWIVQFAERTFGVPMLLGPIEDQAIEPASLDVIALMDVLEHLPDPARTMAHCLRLLKPDGMLLIQTPRYIEGTAYDDLLARQDPFIQQLKHEQHLLLFSQPSITELFSRLGADHIRFEPAMFAQYDMFLAASRAPLIEAPSDGGTRVLASSPGSRLVQALLDSDHQAWDVQRRLTLAELDRAARLNIIHQQAAELARIPGLEARLAAVESDWAARMDVIERQADALARIPGLEAELAASESDRAARLEVIEQQAAGLARIPGLEAELAAAESDRAARLEVIERQAIELGRIPGLEAELAAAESDRAARLDVIQQQAIEIGQLKGALGEAQPNIPLSVATSRDEH
jgi:SAM-dependent methyltransferase